MTTQLFKDVATAKAARSAVATYDRKNLVTLANKLNEFKGNAAVMSDGDIRTEIERVIDALIFDMENSWLVTPVAPVAPTVNPQPAPQITARRPAPAAAAPQTPPPAPPKTVYVTANDPRRYQAQPAHLTILVVNTGDEALDNAKVEHLNDPHNDMKLNAFLVEQRRVDAAVAQTAVTQPVPATAPAHEEEQAEEATVPKDWSKHKAFTFSRIGLGIGNTLSMLALLVMVLFGRIPLFQFFAVVIEIADLIEDIVMLGALVASGQKFGKRHVVAGISVILNVVVIVMILVLPGAWMIVPLIVKIVDTAVEQSMKY